MDDDKARLILAGMRADVVIEQAQSDRLTAARDAVASRSDGVDQSTALADAPPELAGHIGLLTAQGAGGEVARQGWEVKVVDLTQICAFQPNVFVDTTAERVRGIGPDDWEAIAQVTIPVGGQVSLRPQFDELRNTWIIASPNPNLKIVGRFGGQIPGNPNQPPAFGFFVTIAQSFVQVARFRDRLFLRDGYHRALAFLNAGIMRVPAFVGTVAAIEQLAPAGMLPQDAYLGLRPPRLIDYLDDTVSAAVSLPAAQKLVVVQALELNPLG